MALAAGAIAVLAVVLLGGSGYGVTMRLENASQLVKGNLVTVAGEKVGQVKDIKLADDGLAEIEVEIAESEYVPLRGGTRAVVRQASLSGIANRYIELQLGGARGAELEDGARIPAIDTQSAVDLDQLFNTFDPVARTAVSRSIRFFRDLNQGREREARVALRYLSPSLASSSRLFGEINRNRRDFERFIVETGRLTTDLAARDDDLAGLISNLSTTMNALAAERDDLGRSVDLLPDVLRRANTTFVNLRATLDDLDPLVAESRPALRATRPLFASLRTFAAGAGPTVRNLSRTIRQPGAANDLIDLLRLQPAVDRIANQAALRNGERRDGAFPATQRALRGVTPQFAFLRPYTVDLLGWFDDFSRTGAYDALGSFSRSGGAVNQFTFSPERPNTLLPVPLPLRDDALFGSVSIGRNNRCPGAAERSIDGSNPFVPSADFNCDRSQVPIGP